MADPIEQTWANILNLVANAPGRKTEFSRAAVFVQRGDERAQISTAGFALRHLLRELVAAEREACAALAEQMAVDHDDNAADMDHDGDADAAVAFRDMAEVARELAAQIRARGGP